MPSRLRRWDEPGHVHFWTVSCYRRLTFFWHDAMKRVAVDGLRVLQERFGVCLIAYVVMPEHRHLVVYPHEGKKRKRGQKRKKGDAARFGRRPRVTSSSRPHRPAALRSGIELRPLSVPRRRRQSFTVTRLSSSRNRSDEAEGFLLIASATFSR